MENIHVLQHASRGCCHVMACGMQFKAEIRSDSRLQFGGLGPGIGGPETLRTAVERMETEQGLDLKAQ